MPTKKKVIKTYLTNEEYEAIKNLAYETGLSASGFIKRVCLNYPIKSLTDRDAVIALIGIKGNIGRIGGLLKQYLSQYRHNTEVRNFLKTIEADKKRIDEQIQEIAKAMIQAGKR